MHLMHTFRLHNEKTDRGQAMAALGKSDVGRGICVAAGEHASRSSDTGARASCYPYFFGPSHPPHGAGRLPSPLEALGSGGARNAYMHLYSMKTHHVFRHLAPTTLLDVSIHTRTLFFHLLPHSLLFAHGVTRHCHRIVSRVPLLSVHLL